MKFLAVVILLFSTFVHADDILGDWAGKSLTQWVYSQELKSQISNLEQQISIRKQQLETHSPSLTRQQMRELMMLPMGYCKVSVIEDKETKFEHYGLLGLHTFKIEKNGKAVTVSINDSTPQDTKIHPQNNFPKNDSLTFHIVVKSPLVETMSLSYDLMARQLLSANFQDSKSDVRCFERD